MRYRKSPVFIGIGAVVVIALVLAAIDPTGRLAADVVAPLAVLLFVGILLYQWRWAGRAQNAPVSSAARLGPGSDLGQVSDQYEMFVALALRPITDEEISKARAGVFGLVRANIKLGAVIAILPAAAAVMIITGWVPDLGNGKYVVLAPVILAPLALAWVRYSMASAGQSAGNLLEPIGLTLTAMPQVGMRREPSMFGGGRNMRTDIRGATEMDGERYGRHVHITLGGKQVTQLSGSYPEFEIGRKGQKLQVKGEAPAPVAELITSLGPSPAWKAFKKLVSGPDGLAATRGVDAEGGWLWDLWLCERLAGAAGAVEPAAAAGAEKESGSGRARPTA